MIFIDEIISAVYITDSELKTKKIYELNKLAESVLPSGSGFDSGTNINWDKSNKNKIVFNTAFHHMNDAGYYDNWTYHQITYFIKEQKIKISGRNKNLIKEYIEDTFYFILKQPIVLNLP